MKSVATEILAETTGGVGIAGQGNIEPEAPFIRIQPPRGWIPLNLPELWHYRELFFFLVWRDIKIRYKQTFLGAAWAMLQPLLTMLVFTLFFGRLAKMPSDGVPYPIFTFTALVPWMFFANGLTQASNSLVGSANLITKIYFPRFIVPASAVLSGGVDMLIALAMLFTMMKYYKLPFSARLLWLPPLILLALLTALGTGLWLSALNVRYRDVRHILPFLSQLWMFATPVAYPSSLVREPWHTLYGLNPMAGVIDGFRWALLGGQTRPGGAILVSSAMVLILFVTGMLFFRRMERIFADLV